MCLNHSASDPIRPGGWGQHDRDSRRVEFLHEFGVDDVVREGSRRFDALEPPELGEKVERTLHTLLSRVS